MIRHASVFAIVLLLPFIAAAQGKTKAPFKPTFDVEKKVADYLKENVNDLSKFMIVKFSKPFNPKGWTVLSRDAVGKISYEGVAIYVKYRTANKLGAVELMEDVFILSADGKGQNHYKATEVHAPGDIRMPDRFMDSFLEQFR